MADRELDPRFDPRYQRGFDPALHETPDDRRSSLSRPTAASPLDAAPAVAASASPVPRAQVLVPPPVPPAAGLGELDQRGTWADDDTSLDAPTRNPFRLALLVASLAAIAASAALVVATYRTSYSYSSTDTSPGELFLTQFPQYAYGPLFTVGLIGLVLWVAVGAVIPGGTDDD